MFFKVGESYTFESMDSNYTSRNGHTVKILRVVRLPGDHSDSYSVLDYDDHSVFTAFFNELFAI